MPNPIYRGNTAPQLQKQVYSWNAQRGGQYAESWQGLDPALASAYYNGRIYTCQEAQMTVTNGVAELELKWGASGTGGGPGAANSIEVTIDRWECPEPKIEKPVFNHPTFLAYFSAALTFFGVTPTDDNIAVYLAAWRAGAASGTDFRNFIPGSNWATFVAANPTAAGYLARGYQKVANDQTHYEDCVYSVRHTTECPNYWSLNRADQNVRCIYTPAQFMSEATDGTLWYFPLPGRLQFKLAAAVSTLTGVTPARAYYLIGWKKSASGETSIHGGRIEINTTYVLDQWSTDLYNFAT